ncbi:MAG: hypothetical protein CML13_08440 [Puniceicoccaceae bacterium]|nr:hypothetical protein [Puniceicoccaceae bacterium]|tara:strand:- start:514 stop:1269 length:756 start_codon:yes stop_codon:yes gene_type:complete
MYSSYSTVRSFQYLILVVCLGFGLALEAQIPTETVAPQIKADISFYLVGVPDANRSLTYLDEHGPSPSFEFYVMSEAGLPQLVAVHPGESSEEVSYHGPRAFSLYRSVGVSDAGEPILHAIATVTLPEGWTGGMLAILRGEGELRIFPFDRKLKDTTRNMALFLNVSDVPVLCRAMDEMFQLGSFQSKSILLDTVKSDFQLNLKCAIRPGDDDWRVVYSGSQTVLKDQYYIFLLVADERQKSYRLVRFRGE